MKTRHHLSIILIALLAGLMGFATDAAWAQGPTLEEKYPDLSSTETHITIQWRAAKDNKTPQNRLKYWIYVANDPNLLKDPYRKKDILAVNGLQGAITGSDNYFTYTTNSYYDGRPNTLITGLHPGTLYHVVIAVVDGDDNVTYYNQDRIRTKGKNDDTKAPKPQGYVDGYPKAISPTEIEVKWKPATDEGTAQDKLEYQVNWTPNISWDFISMSGFLQTCEYKISGLNPNTTHKIYVEVLDKGGNTAKYEEYVIKTPATDTERPKPKGFVDGYPKAISPTEIEVKWNPADDNVTKPENMRYQVTCVIFKKDMKKCPVLTGKTEYTITDLPYSDMTYEISIKVWDEAGNYSFYEVKQVTPPAATPPTITLSENEITLNADGGEKTINVTSGSNWSTKVDPESALITNGGWLTATSSSHSTVTVNPLEIKATPNTGTTDRTAKIILTSKKDASVTATLTVKQKGKAKPAPVVPVSSVTLDLPKVTIDGDRKSFRLEATVLPANATNPALQWSSSNPSVASVEAASLLRSGSVMGRTVTVRIHKKGKAEITAKATDGSGKMASCQVEVLSTVGNIEASAARIYALDGTLRLTLPQAATVRIYNVSGTLVRTLNASAGDTSVALPAGIYMIRIGQQTTKVMIR